MDHENALYGIQDLIAAAVKHRDHTRQSDALLRGNISNEGLRRLVLLSYYASQTVEEGHYPTFRIYVRPSDNGLPSVDIPWQMLRFQVPVELSDVDSIRRLAPSASSQDFALEVEESTLNGNEPRLLCVGIILAHSGATAVEPLSPTIWATAVRLGLMIRVDAPGSVRVSEASCGLDLKAGRLTKLGTFPLHPVQRWMDDLANRDNPGDLIVRARQHVINFGWNELLGLASDIGRGACFIVLPTDGSSDAVTTEYEIYLKYKTFGPEVGKAMIDFVSLCESNVPPKSNVLFDQINNWLTRRRDLESLIRVLAKVSSVDGCTVFNRELCLLGFGGKINLTNAKKQRAFFDFRNNEPLSQEALKKTGTRHLSAFRLCDHHDGVWCYVVSQDGDATLFWSDSEAAYRWTPYWPWSKRSRQS